MGNDSPWDSKTYVCLPRSPFEAPTIDVSDEIQEVKLHTNEHAYGRSQGTTLERCQLQHHLAQVESANHRWQNHVIVPR